MERKEETEHISDERDMEELEELEDEGEVISKNTGEHEEPLQGKQEGDYEMEIDGTKDMAKDAEGSADREAAGTGERPEGQRGIEDGPLGDFRQAEAVNEETIAASTKSMPFASWAGQKSEESGKESKGRRLSKEGTKRRHRFNPMPNFAPDTRERHGSVKNSDT